MFLVLVTPLILLGAIGLLISAEARATSSVFVLGAMLYLVFIYLFSRLACYIYNVVAQRIGGFEFTVSDITHS